MRLVHSPPKLRPFCPQFSFTFLSALFISRFFGTKAVGVVETRNCEIQHTLLLKRFNRAKFQFQPLGLEHNQHWQQTKVDFLLQLWCQFTVWRRVCNERVQVGRAAHLQRDSAAGLGSRARGTDRRHLRHCRVVRQTQHDLR